MKVNISELAKLYGISNQTLHYYETKKILSPKRGILNNYRYYSSCDLKQLGAIKKYRNAEFSMKTSIELCNKDSKEEVINKFKRQKESLIKELEKKNLLLDQFNETLTLYSQFNEQANTFHVQEFETAYMLVSYGKEIVFQDETLRSEGMPWIKNIFLTRASKLYTFNEVTREVTKVAHGIFASTAVKKYLKLKVTQNIRVIEGGLFVVALFDSENQSQIESIIQKGIQYVEDEGYILRSDPFVNTVFSYKNGDDAYTLFMQLLIPVSYKE